MSEPRVNLRVLLLGVAVSLLVHAAGGWLLVSLSADGSSTAEHSREHPERDRPRPGIERSSAATINWIGYDQYRRHLAPQADVEQAAMTRAPDADQAVPPGRPQGQPDAPQRAEAASPKPADAFPAAEKARETARAALSMLSRAADRLRRLPEAARMRLEDRLAPEPQNAPEEQAAESAAPQADTAEQADRPSETEQQDRPARQGAEAGGRKEASPTSIEEPVEVEPGKPLAMQGLDIRTVEPRFSQYTLVTARPRNPLVRVWFDREGEVARARVLESSGYDNVDGPLLDAIYRWRASGERLQSLPQRDPPATVAMTFRINFQ